MQRRTKLPLVILACTTLLPSISHGATYTTTTTLADSPTGASVSDTSTAPNTVTMSSGTIGQIGVMLGMPSQASTDADTSNWTISVTGTGSNNSDTIGVALAENTRGNAIISNSSSTVSSTAGPAAAINIYGNTTADSLTLNNVTASATSTSGSATGVNNASLTTDLNITGSTVTATTAAAATGVLSNSDNTTITNSDISAASSSAAGIGVSLWGSASTTARSATLDSTSVTGSTTGINAHSSTTGGSTIDITNGSTISGDSPGAAALRITDSSNAPASNSMTVNVSGSSALTGDDAVKYEAANGSVNVTDGSNLDGDVRTTGSATSSAKGALSLEGTGTAWAGNAVIDNTGTTEAGAAVQGAGLNDLNITVADQAVWSGDAMVQGTTAGLTNQSTLSVGVSSAGSWTGNAIQNEAGIANNMQISLTEGGQWQGNSEMSNGSAGITTVSVDGAGSTWLGDAKSDTTATGSTTIDVSNGAVWEGGVQDERALPSSNVMALQATPGTSEVNLTSGSTWVNTSDSSVASVNINNATLEMRNGNVSTQSITGSGATVVSDYNEATSQFNTLSAGTASGDFNVVARDVGSAGHDPANATLMSVGYATPGDLTITGTSDIGTYQYQTTSVVNEDGSVTVKLDDGSCTDASCQPPAPDDGGNDNGGNDDNKPRPLSTQAKAAVNTRSASTLLWYAGEEALDGRMNDSRRGNENNRGVWLNTFGGKQKQSSDNAGSYDANISGVMVGADNVFRATSDSTLVLGWSASWSTADLSMNNANGDVDSYSGHVYSSLRFNNGVYVEGTLGAAHFDSSQDVISTDGTLSNGNYSSNGYGASLKAGYSWKPVQRAFVEPYAKVSAMQQDKTSYKTSNGMKVNDDAYKSLRLEAGVDAGVCTGRNDNVCPYVHLASVTELKDNNSEQINGERINNSIDGTGMVAGAGVRMQLTKNLSAHAAVNYGKGENSESPWQGNVGVNWSF